MEESDDMYCSLYKEYYCTNSQAISPGKVICKFSNPIFNMNKIEESTNIYNVEPFIIMCVCDIL